MFFHQTSTVNIVRHVVKLKMAHSSFAAVSDVAQRLLRIFDLLMLSGLKEKELWRDFVFWMYFHSSFQLHGFYYTANPNPLDSKGLQNLLKNCFMLLAEELPGTQWPAVRCHGYGDHGPKLWTNYLDYKFVQPWEITQGVKCSTRAVRLVREKDCAGLTT
ncbi:hypothetical protein Tco_0660757 [Tanacetum coccineum]